MAALEAIFFSLTLLAFDARNMQLLVTGLILAATLLVGAGAIALLKRWWRQRGPEEDLSPSAQLAHFRSLYEAGAISQEEFERLRTFLGAKMRETLGVPPPASHTPAQPPPDGNGQPPDNPETDIRPA
jgi:Short C-terminal domain